MKYIGIGKKDRVCANCKYYCQYYVYSDYFREYSEVSYGHCMFPRVKDRKATDTCEYFHSKYPSSDDRNIKIERIYKALKKLSDASLDVIDSNIEALEKTDRR